MEDMSESEARIAWLWVIEAMASFKEVNLSLIYDLVKEAPELPRGLAQNAKERIALRCLEDLCARQSRRTSDVPSSTQDSKVEFDFSESCENVLQRILQEASESDLKVGGPKLAKWDIQPFVRHKNAHLPKLALEKLRESILDGTHPYADFLRDKSGLGTAKRENEVCKNGENRNAVASWPDSTHLDVENNRVEHSSDPVVEVKDKNLERNLLNGDASCKRGRSDSIDEDRAGDLKNCDDIDNSDFQNVNVKKTKLNDNQTVDQDSVPLHGDRAGDLKNCDVIDNSDFQNVNVKKTELNYNQTVDQDSVPLHEKESREEVCERNVSANASGGELARSKIDTEEEGTLLEGDGDECTVLKQSDDCVNDGLCEDELEIHLNADVIPQDTTTSEPRGICSAEGSQNVSENCVEPSEVPSVETVHKSPAKEPKSSHKHGPEFQEPDSSARDGLQGKTNASEAKEKVNEGRETEISSDSDGYHKERTDVAKKKHEFLNSQPTDSHDFIVADSSEQSLCMKCNEAGQTLACSSDNCQVVVHEKCIGSLAIFDDKGNFYCPFCAYSRAITDYLEAKKRSASSQKDLGEFIRKGSMEHRPKKSTKKSKKKKENRRSLRKDGQSKERGENEGNQVVREYNGPKHHNVIVDNQQAEASEEGNNNANLKCEKEGDKVVEENLCDRGCEGQENKVSRKSAKLSDSNAVTGLVNKGNKDLGIQPQVAKQQGADSPKKLAQEFSISSEGDDDESTALNYFIRIRNKETQLCSNDYPSVPQSRRKKIPWTTEEEQKLKEGMEIFSDENKISWKKVMEFGGPVFQDGRTPGDLKDKWRNMCKYQKSK